MKRLGISKQLRIRSSTESNVRWGSDQDSLQGTGWKMVESCEETIALEESMENIRKQEETVGKMRTLQDGNSGKTRRKT